MAHFCSSSSPLKALKWIVGRISLLHYTEAGRWEEQNLLTHAKEPDEPVVCSHIKQLPCLNAVFIRNHTKEDAFWKSQTDMYIKHTG